MSRHAFLAIYGASAVALAAAPACGAHAASAADGSDVPALVVQAQPVASSAGTDVEQAYANVRAGDDEAAMTGFARADAAGQLPPSALRDAGYAAMRAGKDEEAVRYWRRAVDAANSGALQLSAQDLLNTKREVAEVSRRWGAYASVTYRGSGLVPGFGATDNLVDSKSLQAGAEVYWRPLGYQNGRYVEMFARSFQTLDSETGPTGADSRQSGLGARWKPFKEQNLVLSLSRTQTHAEPDDWLTQVAWSLDRGTDVRLDTTRWWTTRAYAEVGRYTQRGRTYGIASVQAGRSFCVTGVSPCIALFPHVVAAAEYDSALARNLSTGAGVGLSLRSWFRSTAYAAPQSYVDFVLQYRARLSGDDRIKGIFFTALLSF